MIIAIRLASSVDRRHTGKPGKKWEVYFYAHYCFYIIVEFFELQFEYAPK
jgi:hypothetical protein